MTPEEIRAKGFTILTDPSQIDKFDIKGQSGGTGASGSFLYGTPKARSLDATPGVSSDRTLEGTLGGAESGRELTPSFSPSSDSSFANLRALLKQTARASAAKGPSAEDDLKMYAERGISLTPSSMASAIERGTISRRGMIEDTYKSALDLIGEQQKNQEQYLSTVMSALPNSFVATMTGKDWDELKGGNVSPELQERIAVAQEGEAEIDTQIVTAGGRQLLVNKQTGETIRDLGGAYKPTGGVDRGLPDVEKQIKQIQDDAVELIEKYAGAKMEWGEMYDTMKIKHPDMPADAINELLGGGVPYDSETGEFDTSKAFGRAVTRE